MDVFVRTIFVDFILFCLILPPVVDGRIDGADPQACNSLKPAHGSVPQNLGIPYKVTANSEEYTPGETVQGRVSYFVYYLFYFISLLFYLCINIYFLERCQIMHLFITRVYS